MASAAARVVDRVMSSSKAEIVPAQQPPRSRLPATFRRDQEHYPPLPHAFQPGKRRLMLEIYLVCAPGLETLLGAEARALGLRVRAVEPGGVTVDGELADVVRANIGLRTASRVLVRVASFKATAFH